MQATTKSPRAIDILKAEHDVILVILDCLEKVTADAVRTRRLDLESAQEILDFLGTFADLCHHGKEENCLFPALLAKGLPREVGPVAVMLAEHQLGRAEISGLRTAVADCERGDARAVERFDVHARAYVELLRAHIAKENDVLFPLADAMLGDAGQSAVLAAFEHVEADDLGAGTHERYLALAGELARRWKVDTARRAPLRGGACCGHSPCH